MRGAAAIGILIGSLIGWGTAAAEPVATDREVVPVGSSEAQLSAIGSELITVPAGVLVVSRADFGQRSVVLAGSDGSTRQELVVDGTLAARGARLVAVGVAGQDLADQGQVSSPTDPVIRLYRIPAPDEVGFELLATVPLPEDVVAGTRRFGSDISFGGNAIAVVSETTGTSDRVDIFTLSAADELVWAQTIEVGTLNTTVAVSDSGATIATSGVSRFAGSGELTVHRIGPQGWVATQRFLRIGGGPVVIADDRIWVQRNSFFERPSGPWSLVAASPGQEMQVVADLPVEGSSLAADAGVVAVGDPATDRVYLLDLRANGSRAIEYSHAVAAPAGDPGGDSPRFGSAVALSGGRLFVGAPAPSSTDPAGTVYTFTIEQGPRRCTVTGTSGPDLLSGNPDGGPSTICGLGGDDTLTALHPLDRLFGGDGDDVLEADDAALLDGGPGSDTCPSLADTATISCELLDTVTR